MACTSSTAWCLARRAGQAEQVAQDGRGRAARTPRRTRHARRDGRPEPGSRGLRARDRRPVRGRRLRPDAVPHVLEELETSEPAEYVFERIHQRLEHAVEREQEERHAARTKESINLAEYPASFEWRAENGAPLHRPARPDQFGQDPPRDGGAGRRPPAASTSRRCACWRWKTTNACSRRAPGRHAAGKVSLVTGEERRLAENATHVASTVEMLDTRPGSKWP
jgi:hypothetical protein